VLQYCLGQAERGIRPSDKDDEMKLNRITTDPNICGGKPCIRGLRFPVSRLLGLLAAGEALDSILRAYPYLEPEDVAEALAYAAMLADEQIIEFA
jgi:uncharacterized protein (DUF433 family)